MMLHRVRLATVLFSAWVLSQAPVWADEQVPDADDQAPAWDADVVRTTHAVQLDSGDTIDYEAAAGTMTLPDYQGKARADIFFVAYTRLGVEDVSSRPILFAFNGGPGSSSVWLHMGALGPRRVAMADAEGAPPEPPGGIVQNGSTWLDLADLVFIDPVSTGYSRPVEGESRGQFHGLDQDVSSVGDFIRLYLTRARRWSSPKYLAGESYGTTRAAGLSGYLQSEHGIFLNGIVLISPVLNFQTVRFAVGNDLPYWLYVPTYAATAWRHERLPARLQIDLDATLREVEAWVRAEYVPALIAGDTIDAATEEEVARKLAEYTGLSEEFVRGSNLRIGIFHFVKELLRDERRVVGRLDSRYTAIEREHVSDGAERDPSYSAILGPYTAALNDYVRRELGYENDHPYEILTGRVQPWDYGSHENRYVNVAETLRSAISQNPSLRVLSCSGYYDLATPYFAMDYTISHMGLPREHRGNVTQVYYRSGHMMYVRLDDLRKLKSDVESWMND